MAEGDFLSFVQVHALQQSWGVFFVGWKIHNQKKKARPPKMVDHHLFGIFSSFFDLLLIIGILGFQKIIDIYTTPKAIPEKP